MDLKVLGKMASSLASKYIFSQGNLNSFILSKSGKIAKFMDPILKEAISGLYFETTATRCSGVWPKPPPVVVQRIRSHLLLTLVKTFPKSSKSGVGIPVSG